MSNKELYKNTFKKLHTSKEVNVEEIMMKNKGGFRMKKNFVVIVCVLIMVFAMTCVANAATGGKLVSTVKLWINGSEADADAYIQEDGSIKIDMEGGEQAIVENEDGDTTQIEWENGEGSIEIEDDGSANIDIQEVGDNAESDEDAKDVPKAE